MLAGNPLWIEKRERSRLHRNRQRGVKNIARGVRRIDMHFYGDRILRQRSSSADLQQHQQHQAAKFYLVSLDHVRHVVDPFHSIVIRRIRVVLVNVNSERVGEATEYL